MTARYEICLLDGQIIILPTLRQWMEELIGDDSIDPLRITKSIGRLIRLDIEQMRDYPSEIAVGARGMIMGPADSALVPITLLKTETPWLRVHLGYAACKTCGLESVIADPTVPELFFGIFNYQNLREEAWRLFKDHPARCPNCSAAFQRNAIWAKPINSRYKEEG